MTLKGVAVLGLCALVVLGTAWARWRLTHGPLRGPRGGPRER